MLPMAEKDHGLSDVSNGQVHFDEKKLGNELKLIEAVACAKLGHMINLGLNLAIALHLEETLKLAEPGLSSLRLVLVD